MRRALWLTVATAVLAGSASALAARPLETAVLDLQAGSADMPAAYARVSRLGARKMRIFGFWSAIAPAQRPPGFDPSNPDSPGYNWSSLDRQISLAYAAGLDPIVALFSAPPWAE